MKTYYSYLISYTSVRHFLHHHCHHPLLLASLGLVSPGAATTDGVSPIFPGKKLTTILVIAVCKVTDDLFDFF